MIKSVRKIYCGLTSLRQETEMHNCMRRPVGPHFPQSCNTQNETMWRLSTQRVSNRKQTGKMGENWRWYDKLIVPIVRRIWNTPHKTYEKELRQYKSLAWTGSLEKVWRKHIVSITPWPWEKKTVWAWTFLSPKSSFVPLSAVSVALVPTSYAPRGFSAALQRFVTGPQPVWLERLLSCDCCPPESSPVLRVLIFLPPAKVHSFNRIVITNVTTMAVQLYSTRCK